MWSDFRVGYTDVVYTEKYSASTTVSLNECYVSENTDEYWISSELCGLSGKVCKHSSYGDQLSTLISEYKEMEKNATRRTNLINFVNEVSVAHTPPSVLVTRINNVKVNSYRSGQSSKMREIQKVLGIHG